VSLAVVVLIPYLIAAFTGWLKRQQLGTLDTHEPRTQSARLTGAGARAVAAQANAWEAVAVYTAALLAASYAHLDPARLAVPIVIFLTARVAHAVCYVADLALARSAVFIVALGACVCIFVRALAA